MAVFGIYARSAPVTGVKIGPKDRGNRIDQTSVITAAPWYRSLESTQWRALVAANLGWLFDGYENYALILTAGLALHQLLDVSQASLIPAYVGGLIAINVFSWGLGGMLGGVLADYIGRLYRARSLAYRRAATDSVVRSSVMPSTKYCCAGSLARLVNGSTIIDNRGTSEEPENQRDFACQAAAAPASSISVAPIQIMGRRTG
jgi:hypothetical protein